MILYGQILNGKFTPLPNLVGSFLELTKSLEGERVSVEFKKESKKRSTLQNSYAHAVIFPHWSEFVKARFGYGLTSEEAKQHVKSRFLTYEIINHKGNKLTFTKDTSKLSVEEFSDFIEKINAFLLEWDYSEIPAPFWKEDESILKDEHK